MKMYLSSYKFGDDTRKLKSLIPKNKKMGYIANALDFSGVDAIKKQEHIKSDLEGLKELGFNVELIDLKNYFGKQKELREKVDTLGAVWVSGGNVFVLRQAMHLSGFDGILQNKKGEDDFLYGAYSAGVCVLSPSLDGYQIVDDAHDTPYKELDSVLWDGLGIIDYTFLPHYQSGHTESSGIEKELEYCKEKNIPYKTLKDGEVIVE